MAQGKYRKAKGIKNMDPIPNKNREPWMHDKIFKQRAEDHAETDG